MSATQKPQRAFLTVTLITVLAVTTVFIVYAAILATYVGQNVTVSRVGGYVEYSRNQYSWSQSAFSINNGSDWYARLVITNPTTQTIGVTWTLQCITNSTSYQRVTTTGFPLDPTNNIVYATTSGTNSSNYNWGQDTRGLLVDTVIFKVKAEVSG